MKCWDVFYMDHLDSESDLQSRMYLVAIYIEKAFKNLDKNINIINICSGRGFDVYQAEIDYDRISNIYLIDNDKKNLKIAKHYFNRKEKTNIRYLKKDARKSNSFIDLPKQDIIICAGFLGAIKNNPEIFIKFLKQIINYNGYVVWTLKTDDTESIKIMNNIFMENDFITLSCDYTDRGRFTCFLTKFIGEPESLIRDVKLMDLDF